MTDSEKSLGELGQKVCPDWFMIETIEWFSIECRKTKTKQLLTN